MITENIFLELSRKVQNLGFKQSLIEISKIAFEEMPIDRLTVWTFEKGNKMKCRFKSDTEKTFNCSETIDLDTYPNYYNTLKQENIIVVNDVHTDPRTFELTEYYSKRGIISSLHIPIFVDGILYGMVFFSACEKQRFWSSEDVKFGSDVSQIISIAYISSKRNEDLRKLNSYAEKIKQYNTELQETIQRKNEQFVEYGFINSHLLNAPLSRLKGLMNLLVHELNNEKRKPDIDFIVSKIYEEYDEMDNIVTKISVLIDKGASPDRDDIET